jgi:hypothetical protein
MPHKEVFFQVLNELLPMKSYFGQEWVISVIAERACEETRQSRMRENLTAGIIEGSLNKSMDEAWLLL